MKKKKIRTYIIKLKILKKQKKKRKKLENLKK